MDYIKKIWATIKEYASKFWVWFAPYWHQFRKWRKRVWKKYHINKIILLSLLTVTLVMSVYLFYLAKNTNVSSLKSGLEQVTTIYDKDGDEAGTTSKYGAKGSFVTIDNISPYIKDAVISTCRGLSRRDATAVVSKVWVS